MDGVDNVYYDAYFDLIDKNSDSNYFGITDLKPIDKGVENDYDNTKATDSHIETYIGGQEGLDNSISESTKDRETTTNDDLYSKQPHQQGIDEGRQTTQKSIGNIKELDSSFSGETKYSISKNRLIYE